jgi:hypothetical protein
MTLEEEMDAFMKARIEQSHAYNEFLAKGDNIGSRDLQRVLSVVMGVHREAILRLAKEIDDIAAGK